MPRTEVAAHVENKSSGVARWLTNLFLFCPALGSPAVVMISGCSGIFVTILNYQCTDGLVLDRKSVV